MNSLIILALVNMVDAFLQIFVSTRLFKHFLSVKTMTLMTAIYGLAIFSVRKVFIFFEVPLGAHTLILVVISILILVLIGKLFWVYAIIGVMASITLINLGGPLAYKFITLVDWDIQEVLSSPWLLTMVAYAEMTYLIIAAIILKITKFNIPDMLKVSK